MHVDTPDPPLPLFAESALITNTGPWALSLPGQQDQWALGLANTIQLLYLHHLQDWQLLILRICFLCKTVVSSKKVFILIGY